MNQSDSAMLEGYQLTSCVHTGLGPGGGGRCREAMALLCQRLGLRTHTGGVIFIKLETASAGKADRVGLGAWKNKSEKTESEKTEAQ